MTAQGRYLASNKNPSKSTLDAFELLDSQPWADGQSDRPVPYHARLLVTTETTSNLESPATSKGIPTRRSRGCFECPSANAGSSARCPNQSHAAPVVSLRWTSLASQNSDLSSNEARYDGAKLADRFSIDEPPVHPIRSSRDKFFLAMTFLLRHPSQLDSVDRIAAV